MLKVELTVHQQHTGVLSRGQCGGGPAKTAATRGPSWFNVTAAARKAGGRHCRSPCTVLRGKEKLPCIAGLQRPTPLSSRPASWPAPPELTAAIPLIDLDGQSHRQVVVDREPGQYLGHPTTVLLEDNKTMLCVYPKGHGRGAIVYKRSEDAGLSWSDRLPTPASWATSQEVPTLHRVIGPDGAKTDHHVLGALSGTHGRHGGRRKNVVGAEARRRLGRHRDHGLRRTAPHGARPLPGHVPR